MFTFFYILSIYMHMFERYFFKRVALALSHPLIEGTGEYLDVLLVTTCLRHCFSETCTLILRRSSPDS